jgi:adenylate cyclase
VRCAIEVQNAMVERNAGVPEDRRIVFRIGIHIGDVVEESDGDLMGDGVNIAARLEGVAKPGTICLSEDAYRQVKSRLKMNVSELGATQLKNIAEPINVYALEVGGASEERPAPKSESATPEKSPVRGASLDKVSIAVLPFANMSGDAEQEYFADGISEDIITALSKLSQLFVIARNSSFTFKGKNVLVMEIGRSLGVRYVLEGSVRKSGSRVRITAQLNDATTGGHVWAERFDREMIDIFAVQDDVTTKIVSALALSLSASDRRRIATEHTENLEAYDCFLRGREQWWRHTREPNTQARELLERAVQLDPNFAPAHLYLGAANTMDYINGWSISPERSLQAAHECARRAVTLDDTYPYAHWGLALVNLWRNQLEDANREAERAIELDPNFADGYVALGHVLHFSGRSGESLECMDRAMALNPYYPDVWLHFRAQATYQLGRY